MSAFELALRASLSSVYSCPPFLDQIVSTVTGSPASTFSAHRPSKSLVVLERWLRFRSEDFELLEGDDGGMDQLDQIASMPEVSQMRGTFARVCVEIDLNKPFIPYLVVEGTRVRVEYENLPMIFFSCCRVGHNKEYCPFANPVHKDNETDMDMTRDIEEEMCSHQVEKLSEMTLDGNQKGPIDLTGDKASFGIWNVVPTRKVWKKNFKNGTIASEDKGKSVTHEVVHKRQEKVIDYDNYLPQKDKKKVVKGVNFAAEIYDSSGSRFNILENECFDGGQEHVFGTSTLDHLLPINGKAIQRQDIGGWNELTPPNKGKKKIGRPRKVLSDISTKSSSRPSIVLRSSSENFPNNPTTTSVSELEQASIKHRDSVTGFADGVFESGEVDALSNDSFFIPKPYITSRDSRVADQDMETQDLRDSESLQLDSDVGEALIDDVSACYIEDGKA
ncbi:hypothetical protein GBA52_003732 [Prunus armeniaca]|nr:hypothetical protein GBA52_003732 [Prunus armeniaca]